MEVVSPDPEQAAPERGRWFGLDRLDGSALVTWCHATEDLDGLVARAREAGLDLGEIMEGSRRTAAGETLRWRMTDPWADRAGGVIPFFIDWGSSVHPGSMLRARCSFVGIEAEHPDSDVVRRWVDVLEVPMVVRNGVAPMLFATIRTPNGEVQIC